MLLGPMKPAVPPLSLLHLDHVGTTTAALTSFQHNILPSPISMPASKRPKLSLQTNSLTTNYGSSSNAASNRPESMATATPTTLNTFSNTFDLTFRPSPTSATISPAFQPRAKSNAVTPLRRKAPYEVSQPLGLRSILKNSTLFSDSRRGSVATSASPRSTRKVFFPPVKKVSFMPVDEEIVTHTYVAKSIDLSSSEEEASDSSQERPASMVVGTELKSENDASLSGMKQADATTTVNTQSPRESARGRRDIRKISPSHRSKRKKRRWEWTIDNLDKKEGEALIQAQNTALKAEPQEESEPIELVEAVLEDINTVATQAADVEVDIVADSVGKANPMPEWRGNFFQLAPEQQVQIPAGIAEMPSETTSKAEQQQ